MKHQDYESLPVSYEPLAGRQGRTKWWLSAMLAAQGLLMVLLLGLVGLVTYQYKLALRFEPSNRGHGHYSSATCEAYLDTDVDEMFSLILTADPGDMSGTPEAHYIIANMKHKQVKTRAHTVCAGHYLGELMGQKVVVVTTGIGPSAAALCTLELLTACGPQIKEMIYFGTSGWSPQKGGILNAPQCDKALSNNQTIRLGDVCISPFSVNWTCKKATWDMQARGHPNQCSHPGQVAGPNATALYGECMFYKDNFEANLDLTEAIASAAASTSGRANFPQRSPNVTQHEALYWGTMQEATKLKFPQPEGSATPKVWHYTECMEVDGQFFYSGAPWETIAREYVADTLNAAMGYKGDSRRGAGDVLAVSAMEGVGMAEALVKYHNLASTTRLIPYTNVRTSSNWLVPPVAQTKPGVWSLYKEVPEDFVNGYGYAIATGSAAILSYYQQQCLKRSGEATAMADAGDSAGAGRKADCSFRIDYGSETDNSVLRIAGSRRVAELQRAAEAQRAFERAAAEMQQ